MAAGGRQKEEHKKHLEKERERIVPFFINFRME